MTEKKMAGRNSNIELLRIFAMMGVVILHYNNPQMGGAFGFVKEGSTSYFLLYILESISICAVDLFIMISGYFMCDSYHRSLIKPLKLLAQVIAFKEAGAVLSLGLGIMSGTGAFSIKDIAGQLLSAAVPNNYFVILYIAIYLLSAYMNLAIKALDANGMRRLLILLMALFSLWPTGVDVFSGLTNTEWIGLSTVGIDGDQGGYTVVNFALMYFAGAYLRKMPQKEYSVKKILLIYIFDIGAITLWALSSQAEYLDISGSAWIYCNPLVILSAMLIFVMFKQLPEWNNRLINSAAKGCFTVFLGHTFFLPYIGVQKFCSMPWVVVMLHIFASCVVIYGICWILYLIYEKISSCVFHRLEKWDVLSESIICNKKPGGGMGNRNLAYSILKIDERPLGLV